MPISSTTKPQPLRVLHKSIAALAVAGAGAFSTSFSAHAQDAGPLIDILVRKGLLTSKEGEEVRAELSKEFPTQTPAAKLKLSESVKELKLYGDLRLRYQYDNRDIQADPDSVGARSTGFDKDRSPSGDQRSRWLFRLRLNADFKLSENFFGGVELQTGIASDGANESFRDGFRDYPIYISKAYLGWSPNEWLTVTAGKVPNPFYTTELVWDPDINPTGITEQIALHRVWAGEVASGSSNDSKGVPSRSAGHTDSRWELTLIAGQFIFDDQLEGGGWEPGAIDNDQTTDAYLFQTQLVGSYRFAKDVKVTLAPGWLVYNGASASGLENNNSFQDRVDANGTVSGATRNLNLLLLPGEVAFKLAGIKTRLLWDFSYNIEGRKRTENIYRLASVVPARNNATADSGHLVKNHSSQDDIAFLAGLQFGENKKRGDWCVLANYRRTGIAAVDPNLNDNDFAEAELNTQGFKIGFAYNLTDFAVFGISYMHAWQIRDIQGGEATGGNAVADSNAVTTLQIDLNLKF